MSSGKADAWLPLWVGDYLAGTSRLTTEQHGAYLLLLMDYWRNGAPPDDDACLGRIARLDRRAWARQRPVIEAFFRLEDGQWRHKRLEAEIADARERSAKALLSAGARHVRNRPHTPRPNGKAERFIQTSLREWAYAKPYTSSSEQTNAIGPWTDDYNTNRPYSGIEGLTPWQRANNLLGNDS